eukprot:Awhi_evm2s14394
MHKLEFDNCPFTGGSLPQIQNDYLTQFVFRSCSLSEIPSGYFKHTPNVIRVIQDDNDFPILKKDWYSGSNLIYIQSQFTNTVAVEERFFEEANQLTGLVANFNKFSTLTEKTYAFASTLLYFTLYNNSLSYVHPHAFGGKVSSSFRFSIVHTTPCEKMEGVFNYFANPSNAGLFNRREDGNAICADSDGTHILRPLSVCGLIPDCANYDANTCECLCAEGTEGTSCENVIDGYYRDTDSLVK